MHHGFCASLDHIADEATKHALYDKIENYLKQHDPEHNAVITLTGHSLGAAMSTEVLRRLQRDGVPSKRIESITFGEPTSENIPSATGTNEFDVALRLHVVNGNATGQTFAAPSLYSNLKSENCAVAAQSYNANERSPPQYS